MVFIVIMISAILSFFMRVLDIYVVFIENNIRLTFSESIRVFFMLLRNFFSTFRYDIKNKKWEDLKDLLSAYLFHFRLLLVLLSSLTFEAIKIKGIDLSHEPAKKHTTILRFIRGAFPMFNNRRRDIALSL